MKSSFWYCGVSIAPVRSEPKDSAEMITQLLFGEIIELMETDRQWRKVKSYSDQYEGWIDEKLILPLTEKELKKWMDRQTLLFYSQYRLSTKTGDLLLTKGCFIPDVEANATVHIGNEEYQLLDVPCDIPNDIQAIAKSYLNAPYLWGGKTLFGIDCSGFTQLVYRFLSISLPRDAYQQAEDGAKIQLKDTQPGDLAFFDNEGGKIIHVGIVLDDQQIIHAHGQVRIDKLDAEGIYNTERSYYSHKLCLIKRYL